MMSLTNSTAVIENNLTRIESRITTALARAGREGDQIQLVIITKGRSPEVVRAAYKSGLRIFGENRVDEALSKQCDLAALEDISWHMVGKIQSRKAKDVAPNFQCVHSLDRVKIAKLLDKHRAGIPDTLSVFIEGNFSGEESKSGFLLANRSDWSEVLGELNEIQSLPNLNIQGIMTMAPWQVDESILRNTFKKAKEFGDEFQARFDCGPMEYSMGMTDDFEIAIEEGATILRLGRAVFAGL